jgi:hypothetical protein
VEPLKLKLQFDNSQSVQAARENKAAWTDSLRASREQAQQFQQAMSAGLGRIRDDSRESIKIQREHLKAFQEFAKGASFGLQSIAKDMVALRANSDAAADGMMKMGRATKDAASSTLGFSSALASVGGGAAVLHALVGFTRDYNASMFEAIQNTEKFAQKGLELQGRLGMFAQVSGRPNTAATQREALQFSARTGLGVNATPGFLEAYGGAAASFERNMGEGEAGRLRELIGTQVAQMGPSVGAGYATNQAGLAASIMSRQKEGQGTASGVFGELGSVNEILGASAGNAEILSRELLQGGSGAVASGQLDWRQAAALTSAYGNVNAGTAGTSVRAAMRTLNKSDSDLYDAAGLKEGMGGVEGLNRVLDQMAKAKGQGRDLPAWLKEMGVTEEESSTALMQLYGQKESGALDQFLGMASGPIEEGAAERGLAARGKADLSYQTRQAAAATEAEQYGKAGRYQAYELQREKARLALEKSGQGENDYGARDRRSWDIAGRLSDWATGNKEGGYGRDLDRQMAAQMGIQDFGGGTTGLEALAGPVGWLYSAGRQSRGGNSGTPEGRERLASRADNIAAGIADPQMDRQTAVLEEIRDSLKNGSTNRTVAPTSRPAAGPAR